MAFIALVDSHPGSCEPLKRLLEHRRHEVRILTADDEVIEALKQSIPDLLILGIRLPQGPELHLLYGIRKEKDLSSLRVVILSTGSEPAIEAETKRLGASEWLLKGMDLTDLVLGIERAISLP